MTNDKLIGKEATTKFDSLNKQQLTESRPTTVTPTSVTLKHRLSNSRPTGFTNQIYPTNQCSINYLQSQSPIYPYTIEHNLQEMRTMMPIKNQMQAHPISSTLTSALTSPNFGSTTKLSKGATGFAIINQPPVAAAYNRSAPSTQQATKRGNTSAPPMKLKRADMYIATRQTKEDLNYPIELLPPPPPPTARRLKKMD